MQIVSLRVLRGTSLIKFNVEKVWSPKGMANAEILKAEEDGRLVYLLEEKLNFWWSWDSESFILWIARPRTQVKITLQWSQIDLLP